MQIKHCMFYMNTAGHCPRFLPYRNIEKKELQNWKRITEIHYYFPSASNNLSASMLRIKKKGAFQKRLSFKYSRSLKVKQDWCKNIAFTGISYLMLFLYIHPTHPNKTRKSLRRERGITECLCVDECYF